MRLHVSSCQYMLVNDTTKNVDQCDISANSPFSFGFSFSFLIVIYDTTADLCIFSIKFSKK